MAGLFFSALSSSDFSSSKGTTSWYFKEHVLSMNLGSAYSEFHFLKQKKENNQMTKDRPKDCLFSVCPHSHPSKQVLNRKPCDELQSEEGRRTCISRWKVEFYRLASKVFRADAKWHQWCPMGPFVPRIKKLLDAKEQK